MNNDNLILPELKNDSWKTENADFWKNYRQTLTKLINNYKKEEKLEMTQKNILYLLESHSIKWTARYFNVQPGTIRYYKNKTNKKDQ